MSVDYSSRPGIVNFLDWVNPYITLDGDLETYFPGVSTFGKAVWIDLSLSMDPDVYADMWLKFKKQTRDDFDNFVKLLLIKKGIGEAKYIVPDNLVQPLKGSLYRMFNEANAEGAKQAGLDVFDWELFKQNAKQAEELSNINSGEVNNDLAAALKIGYDMTFSKIMSLETRYKALPKIPVESVELQRASAIRELIMQQKFDEVENIIKAYEQIGDKITTIFGG